MEEHKELFFGVIDMLIKYIEDQPIQSETADIPTENWNLFIKEYGNLKNFIDEKTDRTAKAISE